MNIAGLNYSLYNTRNAILSFLFHNCSNFHIKITFLFDITWTILTLNKKNQLFLTLNKKNQLFPVFTKFTRFRGVGVGKNRLMFCAAKNFCAATAENISQWEIAEDPDLCE